LFFCKKKLRGDRLSAEPKRKTPGELISTRGKFVVADYTAGWTLLKLKKKRPK
jgi:hypothetical protein